MAERKKQSIPPASTDDAPPSPNPEAPPAEPGEPDVRPAPRRKRTRPPRHIRAEVAIDAGPAELLDLDFDPSGNQFGAPPATDGDLLHLPVIPLRDMVIFPHMVTQFFVGREVSLAAVAESVATDHRILAVAQREPEVEDVTPRDL